MIRVGIVGTNTSHAGVFAGLLNGRDGAAPAVEGARVVGIWSSGEEGLSGMHDDAATMAAAYGIDQVVEQPADLIGAIDLVLVLDDLEGGVLHPELAAPFLRAGVATYIDKPMALSVTEAVELFDLAEQHGAPLMSCSALRFSSELDALRSSSVGELSTLVSVGPGDWYNYGIHAVEAAQSVLGTGAQWVQRYASEHRDLAVVGDESGPRLMIATLRDASTGFHLTAFGSQGRAETGVSDYADFYGNTMKAAVEMARSGTSPIDRQATLEVLGILAAGEQSAATGGQVALSDVLGTGR